MVAYPLAVFASNPLMFFLVLLGYGFANGVTDVALNAQAVEIERAYSITIFSTMHGMFSVGALGVVSPRLGLGLVRNSSSSPLA